MAELIEVAVSGAVGKQVYPTDRSKPVRLCALIATAGSTSASFVIRDGNASGTVKLTVRRPANDSHDYPIECVGFHQGMHVKVIGTGALAYLLVE